jgi:hypothetical protein
MTHRISWNPLLTTAAVLTLGACGGNGVTTTDGAATGTTTGGGTTDTAATTGPGTTAEATAAEPATTTGDAAERATIRVVHLSPDAPTIDLYANGDYGQPLIDGLALRNASTITVPAGDYAFAITADDTPPEETVFEVPAQAYEGGKSYTAIILGKLVDRSFELVRVEDEPADIDPAQVRLQVTHAAPAFAQVDVWTGPRTDMLSLLHADLDFKDTRSADLPDTDFVLALDADDDTRPEVNWDIFGADLTPHLGGEVHVFVYSDAADRPSLQVVTADGPARQIEPE